MSSRENIRGQCRHCLSLWDTHWMCLRCMRIFRPGGWGSRSCSHLSLGARNLPMGPVSLWQINGGICGLEAPATRRTGTAAGWTGWIFITGRCVTPRAPCRLFPVLWKRLWGRMRPRKWWQESGPRRKWSRLREGEGFTLKDALTRWVGQLGREEDGWWGGGERRESHWGRGKDCFGEITRQQQRMRKV